MSHYVYIWYKPNGTPFYVGIGKTRNRWNPNRKGTKRNPFCEAVLAKYGRENILIHVFEVTSVHSAFRWERLYIHRLGRADLGLGPLTNITAGGDGANEMGEFAKAALRAKWSTNTERKKKLSTQSRSAENTARAYRRINDPNDKFGKNGIEALRKVNADVGLTKKRIAALKASSKRISDGVYASMEKRLKTMQTPEVQAKLRAPKSTEHRAKLSAARKAYWAKRKVSS